MYEPSFRRNPVVSVLELSDPARSIKLCGTKHINISWYHSTVDIFNAEQIV